MHIECISFDESQYVDIIVFLTFSKLYASMRVVRDSSPLNTNSGRFIGSFTKIQYTDKFLVKAWLKANPILSLCCPVFVIVVLISYLLYISERSYPIDCVPESQGKLSNYLSSLWLMIVTIMTVGYGDLSALTLPGRALSILGAICGLVVTAILIGLVHQYISLNNNEYVVVKFIEDHRRMMLYKSSALKCVHQGIRLYIYKSLPSRHKSLKQQQDLLDRNVNAFRKYRE